VTRFHWVTVVVALCMALSILGAEWTRQFSGGGFFWLRGTSRIGPSLCLFVLAIGTGAFHGCAGGRRSFYALAGGILIACALVLQASGIGIGDEENLATFDYTSLSLIQAVLFGLMGYWIAQDDREIKWLLSRIAFVCALGSTLGGCNRMAGLEAIPFLVPDWSTRLVFLFGHCWYLNRWLTLPQGHLGALLGLMACSPEVWISFHKPIVFSALVVSAFLFCYSIWTSRWPIMVVRRTAILVSLAAMAFIVVNRTTSGQLLTSVEERFYERFLHQEDSSRVDWRVDNILEKASGGRLTIWREARERIGRHPFVGAGSGQSFGTAAAVDSVYVHNWYLDILLSVGIVGALPIFAGLLWWLRLVARKRVLNYAGNIVVPCLAYIVGLMAYNMGGSIRVFFSMTSFAVLIMAIAARLADRAMASLPVREASLALLPLAITGRTTDNK
jgi:hypothetical protein